MTTAADIGPEFGARLAAARREAGVTQEELALSLGVGKGAVSAWEVGRTQPSAGQLSVITQRLQISADFLLRGAANDAKAGVQ